jgi:AraC family transcriptional regulator, regulatory protein of adaptative response / DNA-3-methyladenine glycosylase II
MPFDADACYRAHRARDARFDGRFFTAVRSTRIYCRPVCAAPLPKRENCSFFASAAAAEAAGFRPCLRCRPELAPGGASVDASARLARDAANLIDDGALADANLAALARRLGATDRHLRRVFESEFGVTPVAYAQTARLLLAKRLLTDTALPVTEVALAAGFGSLRRLNALFLQRYRLNPTALRKSGGRVRPADHHVFRLHTAAPFDFDALLRFFATRAIEGVESAGTMSYRRTLALPIGSGGVAGWLEVRRAPKGLGVEVRVDARLSRAIPRVLAAVKHAFDLHCRPDEINAVLGELAQPRPGVRLPGAFDSLEIAIRAILGQQITVKAARTLAGRLVRRFGTPIETPFEGVDHVFPSAATLAACAPGEIAELGVIASRARTIIALSRLIAEGTLRIDAGADVEQTLAALAELPGVGPWTAHYIAMRALHWPDAFPASDLGILRALGTTRAAVATQQAQAWRPWRAYAVMHLWQQQAATPEAQPTCASMHADSRKRP